MFNNKIISQTDNALIRLACGEQAALSDIYDYMGRLIFSVAYTITGNYEDAEDALQDTMIDIAKYCSSYEFRGNSRAWILTIARHKAIDIVRRRRIVVPIDTVVEAQIPTVTDNGYSDTEVLQLLNCLPDDDKQIIVFRLYAGLSYSEIAKIMDLSVAATQKKYQRALKKLKKLEI